MGWEVEIDGDVVVLRAYPFVGASVHPDGRVAAHQVRDGDDAAIPPELRLQSGETLYLPAPAAPALRSYLRRNGIPRRRRPDVWAALFEPFLQTSLERALAEDPDADARALLAAAGVDDEEVEVIRRRFGAVMTAYNAVLGDTHQLGLPDLLRALRGGLVGERHAVPVEECAEIYRWAMAVADRSRELSVPLG